jgi:uncharacterized protein
MRGYQPSVNNQRQSLRIPLTLALACLAAWGNAALAADEKPEPQVDLAWGVKIPLRDGVKLDATVYRPHEQKTPLPLIFTLTPYIADSYALAQH